MKAPLSTPIRPGKRTRSAFTLIELMVVIGVITVLAALTFPAVKKVKENATRRKVKAELQQIAVAIESYKARYNTYPPDNPVINPTTVNAVTNPLFFELVGTEPAAANEYRTLDQKARIRTADFNAVFGGGVAGFVNHTRDQSGEGQPAENFFSKAGLPSSLIGSYAVGNSVVCLIVTSVPWPANLGNIIPGHPGMNPFRYVSSSPTNNPASYDLWVDIFLGGKTNRISNWSEQRQFVN